jgi:hypothetical protein
MKGMERDMPLLQVCLLGDHPLTSYLGCILKKPDAVVWLRTSSQRQMVTKIENVITTQLSPLFESREIIGHDVEAFRLQCEDILKDYPKHDIIMNVTGGTRLQALLAAEIFKNAGKQVMYIDVDNCQIVDILSGEHKSFIFNFTVNEYTALHGLKVESGTRFDPDIRQRSALSYFIGNNMDRLVPFIDKIRREWNEMGEKKESQQWRLEDQIIKFNVAYDSEHPQMRFRFGVGEKLRTLEIEQNFGSFLFDGGWLRELVFLRVHRGQYDDVRLDVRLDRDSLPEGSRAEHMIDIAMMRGCHLYVFQCFSYPISRESFIELKAVSDIVHLLNARGFVFVAHRPHRGFIERVHEMGMEIISRRRIVNFSL